MFLYAGFNCINSYLNQNVDFVLNDGNYFEYSKSLFALDLQFLDFSSQSLQAVVNKMEWGMEAQDLSLANITCWHIRVIWNEQKVHKCAKRYKENSIQIF